MPHDQPLAPRLAPALSPAPQTPSGNGTADECADHSVDSKTNNALARLMGWVGVTHVRRHHEHYHTRGGGHLYQGRFKSFPVQDDPHFLTVCRYVESNPLRAGIVRRAQDWPYSSLRWAAGMTTAPPPVPLAPWPTDRPPDWLACVNEPLPGEELDRLRESAIRGRPFGDEAWAARTAEALGLTHTLRGPGRPRNERAASPVNTHEQIDRERNQ